MSEADTDNLAGSGHYSIRSNQRPTSIIPPFLRQMPFLSNLSWLGTGKKYAGVHTQWLGKAVMNH